MHVHIKPFNELAPLELYHILKLRQDIFIVEQKVVYSDIDGKDLFSTHFWRQGEASHDILAYLRVVPWEEKEEVSIGRVFTAFSARGQSLARHLIKKAVDFAKMTYPAWALNLQAQDYLRDFYKSLGFKETGPVFYYPDENAVPHVPMTYIK